MVRKIALLGFVSGFALFLYGRKCVLQIERQRASRPLP